MAMEEDPPAGVPEWVVTYGDMMSLLLTFFIMLVSMSKMKEEGTMRAMLDAISESFGATDGPFGVPGISKQRNSIYTKPASKGNKDQGGVEKDSRKSGGIGGPNPQVRTISKGTIVTMGGPVCFTKGSAELLPQLKEDLEQIASLVRDKANVIEVKGHTSPEPLPSDSIYRDHFDLSYARAANVARYLNESLGISSRRLIITAVGDTEPTVITRDSERQQQNHRVDVIILGAYISSQN
jgi:chemotaxis protein MotB